ncbi:MAG TPA: nucleotidyl transferase AbiEii/AbiGii toxin family protein [Anaerolineae bacterium]|nr:nucleotidyl transferase AbiEii/AbiGii toxin family protein [Anaerolineae bacterium]
MIAEAEIRRYAAQWGVDPMVADLDYVLGWFLAALYGTARSAGLLRFKGGTCLRKCYFADYRFSEDLDFTATAPLPSETLMEWVERAMRWAADHDGPDFVAAPARLEVVEDEYGSESYQVRVYYRGPLRWGGSPRAIRLDVTRAERLLLPAAPRRLIHVYSDTEALGQVEIACYALDEIMAEKIRAVGGQRRFAISRDLYDIHQLVQAGVSVAGVAPLLPAKFVARGMDMAALSVERLLESRAEFERDWQRRLSYLVSSANAVTFAAAWQSTVEAVHLAQEMMQR